MDLSPPLGLPQAEALIFDCSPDLSAPQGDEWRAGAIYLAFVWHPSSPAAQQLAEDVACRIEDIGWTNKRSLKSRPKFVEETGRIIGGLLVAAASSPEGWAFRSLKRDGFTDDWVTFRPFDAITKGLREASLI